MKKRTATQTNNWKHLVTTSTMIALASACAPTGFTANPLSPVNSPNKQTVVETPQQCVPDTTDYSWDVNIYGFSMSGTGFNVGYNGQVWGPINTVAVGAQVDSGSIYMSMSMKKPYDTAVRSADSGKQSVTSGFNFAVDLGIVKLGVSNSSDGQAALMSLTKKGYQALVKTGSAQLAKDPNGWSTHITKQLDANRFQIPVGALAGLQYGDKFNVYKYKYDYANAGDCSSVIGGSKAAPATVVATMIPLDIHDGYATMTFVGNPAVTVGVNDLLEVQTLYKAKSSDKRAALKKAVRLVGLHQPNKISVGTADNQIDLTSYLIYQIPSLMNDTNYWLSP